MNSFGDFMCVNQEHAICIGDIANVRKLVSPGRLLKGSFS